MGDDDYIRIAVVTGVHGLKGRLKITVITDINERFQTGVPVYLAAGGGYDEYFIEDFAAHKGKTALLQLRGINDRDAARSLRGCDICITADEAERTRDELDADSYYYRDIIGCAVRLRGRPFGAVTRILEAGAGEVLVVTDEEGKEHMVPFVESMVDTSGIRGRVIEIQPVEGLLDI